MNPVLRISFFHRQLCCNVSVPQIGQAVQPNSIPRRSLQTALNEVKLRTKTKLESKEKSSNCTERSEVANKDKIGMPAHRPLAGTRHSERRSWAASPSYDPRVLSRKMKFFQKLAMSTSNDKAACCTISRLRLGNSAYIEAAPTSCK